MKNLLYVAAFVLFVFAVASKLMGLNSLAGTLFGAALSFGFVAAILS